MFVAKNQSFGLVVVVALLGVVSGAPGYIAGAPLVAAGHVPLGTSYANTYKVSYKSPIVAATPLLSSGIAYTAGAPIYAQPSSSVVRASSLGYAAAPAIGYSGYSHGYVAPVVKSAAPILGYFR